MKKLLFFLTFLSLCAAPFLSACNPDSSRNPGGIKDIEYAKAGEFFWGAYFTPPPEGIFQNNPGYATKEHYQNIADCGFNNAIAIYEESLNTVLPALELCEEVGLTYYPRFLNVNAVINSPPDYELTDSDKNNIKGFLDVVTQSPAFGGIYAVDEPQIGRIPSIKLLRDYVDTIYPGVDLMVSHLAPSARDYQSGTSVPFNRDLHTGYLDVIKPPYLLYDSYSLTQDRFGRPGLFEPYVNDFQMMAEYGAEYGIPVYFFLLSLGHLNYRTTDNYRDMAWQMNLAYSYGFRGALTFTYWTPLGDDPTANYTHALITTTGEKSDIYYAMQQVIDEYKPFNDVYMSFNWKGTMLINGDPDYPNAGFRYVENRLKEHERLTEIICNQDTAIGAFKDANGRDGFMIANQSDPYYNLTSEMSITFADADYVVVWKKGLQRIVPLKNGTYETKIASGEGEFLIPFSK